MEQERGGRRNAARAPDVLAGVVRGVDAAQDELAAGAGQVLAVEPEGEDGLRDQPLVDHVLEGRHRAPDRDLREGQPLRARSDKG